MFENVRDMAQKCDLLVVMIDEVESLSASRTTAAAGAEPSDALRVVNALLTSIDTLRELPNVLVIATSNLTDRIDSAFLDRADVKQYIGLPNVGARYEILRGGVDELVRCGIVCAAGTEAACLALPFDKFKNITLSDHNVPQARQREGIWPASSEKLLQAASAAAEGLSGRCLRKLCLLAHARLSRSGSTDLVPMNAFLDALRCAASSEASLRTGVAAQ